jgi:hypothetical protein
MKKILLIGASFSDNLGDGALCETMQSLLGAQFNVTLLDIYGRQDYPRQSSICADTVEAHYQKACAKIKARNLVLGLGVWPNTSGTKAKLERLANRMEELSGSEGFDAIVFGGGALFKGVFLNYMEQIFRSNKNRVPVIFNACGVDYGMLPVEWKRLGAMLSNDCVRRISVRDGGDLLLQKYPALTFTDSIDPAVMADTVYEPAAAREDVGVGIMLSHKYGYRQQMAFWLGVLRALEEKQLPWRAFTNGGFEDQAFAEAVLREGQFPAERLLPRPTEPKALYEALSGFRAILSMRLHSIILSYAARTPAVAVVWDEKVTAFCKKIGTADSCFSMDTEPERLVKALEQALACGSDFYGATPHEALTAAVLDGIRAIVDLI